MTEDAEELIVKLEDEVNFWKAGYYQMKVANIGHLKGIKRLKERLRVAEADRFVAVQRWTTTAPAFAYLSGKVHPTVLKEAQLVGDRDASQFYDKERKR